MGFVVSENFLNYNTGFWSYSMPVHKSCDASTTSDLSQVYWKAHMRTNESKNAQTKH